MACLPSTATMSSQEEGQLKEHSRGWSGLVAQDVT